MLSLFGFGKRTRRTSTKASKPPARLLKLCKKYRVKTTAKRAGKRSYRPTAMLKKLCLKKARALKKKLMKGRSTTRRTRMGGEMEFGSSCNMGPQMEFGKRRAQMEFGKRRAQMEFGTSEMEFGKRSRKVNKVAAMKAFKSFYRRHCAPRGSRFGFGSGGNPPLWQSMGYEFCSDGGGVLGANSTGLFPTPCMPSQKGARPVARPKSAAPKMARKVGSAVRKAAPKMARKAAPKIARKAVSAVRRVAPMARRSVSAVRQLGSATQKAAAKVARRTAARKVYLAQMAAKRSRKAYLAQMAAKRSRKVFLAQMTANKAKAAARRAASLRRRRAPAFGFGSSYSDCVAKCRRENPGSGMFAKF